MGHTLMENRSGIIVQADLMHAYGHGERKASLDMIHRHSPGSTRRLALGADKGYDSAGFVAELRQAYVTLHIVRKSRYFAIDGRTPRHAGCVLSQKRRKKVEEPSGWPRPWGAWPRPVQRGIEKVKGQFTMTIAAANLAQLSKLLAV